MTTTYGETIKITGDISQLGGWDPGNALPLSADQYTSSKHLWHVTIDFAPGTVIQYKYIRVASDGQVTWENDPDHTYTVPTSCATAVVVNDRWQ